MKIRPSDTVTITEKHGEFTISTGDRERYDKPRMQHLAAFDPKPVAWLWTDRIPLGKEAAGLGFSKKMLWRAVVRDILMDGAADTRPDFGDPCSEFHPPSPKPKRSRKKRQPGNLRES